MIEFRPKRRYTDAEITATIAALNKAAQAGLLTSWNDGSGLLRAGFKGVGGLVHQKWNVKIYQSTARGTAIVCVDFYVLDRLVNHGSLEVSTKPVISIDDAGWGFPLCGVMVGAADDKQFVQDVVPVEYFSNDASTGLATKKYLSDYAHRGIALVTSHFHATPKTHRIEICSGYINQGLREELRKLGYAVTVVEIEGLLQKELENAYRAHVLEQLGLDLYYDPKELNTKSVAAAYYKAVKWGIEHRPKMLKSGWKSINR